MEKLKVFYDGKCPLCYKEIVHYKKKDIHDRLICIDITHADFKHEDYNLNHDEINLRLHGINDSGEIFTGVDTFIEIWARIPNYSFFIKIANNKLLRPPFDLFYIIFAKYIRPTLPKRSCDSGYCELKI
jgi:predicted DCC family thiol-disulfide oxidoreductase YuxK